MSFIIVLLGFGCVGKTRCGVTFCDGYQCEIEYSKRNRLNQRPTKGSLEAEIANAVVRFQREQQGRGAVDVRAHIIGDLVLVRSTGIWTPVEAKLAASDEGRKLIKSSRQELRSINHQEIEAIVAQIVGFQVVLSFFDVDVEAAEQVEVYVLDADVERKLLRQDLNALNQRK